MKPLFLKKLFGKYRPYNLIKTPTILQLSETECGVAALAILLSYYKVNMPIEKLRELCGTSRDGCKATTLMAVANKLGLHAEAYRVEAEALFALHQPVIAFWNFKHYVVINGLGTHKVFINDPASGPTAISMEEFDSSFTGIIMTLTPSKNTALIKSTPVFRPLLKAWITKFHHELSFIMICLVITLLCPLVNSSVGKVFIDYCLTAANLDWIPYLGLLSIVFSCLFCVTNAQQKWSEFKLCAKASIMKTSELALLMLRLPMIFYSLRQKSEVISLLSRAEMIINLLFKNLTKFTIHFISILICLIVMAKMNMTLFTASIMLSSLACYCFYVISKVNLALEKLKMNANSKYYAHTTTSMRNIETIKACGLENNILIKWRNLFAAKISILDKSNTYSLLLESINKFFDAISMIILFMLGSVQIANGNISIGYLMAYYSLHLFYCSNLSGLLQTIKDAETAYASHVRVNNIFCYAVDKRFQNSASPSLLQNEWHFITCQQVDFYYNEALQPTLHNIDLKIKRHQHIAFIGCTGSGKSTLAKLLCALFQAHSGKITVANRDTKSLSETELANLFAYVSQDISLFSGTIYDNLTLWKEGIAASLIDAALQTACLEEVIAVRGLMGKVTENGSNFSGGERQRIDIARALIQNPEVLILDEATSALDNFTEMKLIANLRQLPKTVIYVAHRLSTIQHCDQIFVMANGRIIEHGNHDTLLQKQSHYYQLIQNENRLYAP